MKSMELRNASTLTETKRHFSVSFGATRSKPQQTHVHGVMLLQNNAKPPEFTPEHPAISENQASALLLLALFFIFKLGDAAGNGDAV